MYPLAAVAACVSVSSRCIIAPLALSPPALLNRPGADICPTSSFALAELYIVIAFLFRRFDLKLHDTIRERDIDFVRDCFIGEPSPESVGVRVKAVAATA